jgi:hypothetical protein
VVCGNSKAYFLTSSGLSTRELTSTNDEPVQTFDVKVHLNVRDADVVIYGLFFAGY